MNALAEPRIAADVPETDDEWESLISEGQAAAKAKDRSKWRLGDCAVKVVKRYKENALGKFAAEIGEETATMRGYERVAAFYEKSARVQYSDAISWSHFRLAIRAGENALAFLAECDANGWSVATANRELVRREGKPVPPRKLFDGVLEVCDFVDEWTAVVRGVSEADLGSYRGRRVQVIIREVQE